MNEREAATEERGEKDAGDENRSPPRRLTLHDDEDGKEERQAAEERIEDPVPRDGVDARPLEPREDRREKGWKVGQLLRRPWVAPARERDLERPLAREAPAGPDVRGRVDRKSRAAGRQGPEDP